MANVTIQVLEGVDRGRIFRNLPVPLTIGREEGNLLRLNDERVSRFHAKIQQDDDDIIITDLESTNGTRVNGCVVQIRRLRIGDRISVGRSVLLFGSNEEIASRLATLAPSHTSSHPGTSPDEPQATLQGQLGSLGQPDEFNISPDDQIRVKDGDLFIGTQLLPALPKKLSPAQAARLAEILDFLHRGLTYATENIEANEDASQVSLSYADWQRILAVQMLLARYTRAITDPDSFETGL
ncbi:MAG: peptide-binding protein [Gemmatales bacterium]|nr:MAG: peptide-binding protein [Gemmatales bacterium]